MIGVSYDLAPLSAQFCDGVSEAIQGKRVATFSKDAVNQASSLQDYLVVLFEVPDMNTPFSKNIPWKLAGKLDHWTLKDEIVASSLLLVMNYQKLASNKVVSILESTAPSDQDEQTWKVANNWLKQGLSIVNYLIASQLYNNSIDLLSLNYLNFWNHLLEAAVQLNLLIKINSSKILEIKLNDWSFVIDPKNYLIYLKICIYISDELSICEELLATLPTQKALLEYIRTHKNYIKLYIAMYLVLQNYEAGKLGMGLGIIRYIRAYLLKNQDADEELNKFKKMITKISTSKQNEKDLIKKIASSKDSKLAKGYVKNLSKLCLLDSNNLVRLIDITNLKLLKENNNIKFDTISSTEEVSTEIASLPLGRKIPLTYEPIPSFLKLDGTSKNTYSGSGSYF